MKATAIIMTAFGGTLRFLTGFKHAPNGLSKVQSVDQRMRLECGVGFRQLRTCRRTRPGQLCANRVSGVGSFNHLVGAGEKERWDIEAKRLCCNKIYH